MYMLMFVCVYCFVCIAGSLEVKLLTIWTDGKGQVGRVGEDKGRRKKIREEKESEEIKMQAREKVEKSRSTVFFLCFVAQEDRKVGSLKRRVRSNCTPSWREEHFEVNT